MLQSLNRFYIADSSKQENCKKLWVIDIVKLQTRLNVTKTKKILTKLTTHKTTKSIVAFQSKAHRYP